MKTSFFALGIFFLFSCKRTEAEPTGLNFYFETPQPVHDSQLSNIPNKFQGVFVNSDSVYIIIKKNIILKEYSSQFRFHKNQFDSIKLNFDKIGNKYKSKFNQDIFEFRYINDTIELRNKQIDTFFLFSNKQKAKRINGQLILNYSDSNFWTIKTIQLEKDVLKVKYIFSENDLKIIDSLLKIKPIQLDSSSFVIKPTRTEFKRLLNTNQIGEELVYKKITN